MRFRLHLGMSYAKSLGSDFFIATMFPWGKWGDSKMLVSESGVHKEKGEKVPVLDVLSESH